MLPPGSSKLEVGNFGVCLGQFLMMFGLLGKFFPREKTLKKNNFGLEMVCSALKLPYLEQFPKNIRCGALAIS